MVEDISVTMVTYLLPWLHICYHCYISVTMVTYLLPWLHICYHGYISVTMVTYLLPWLHICYHGYISVTMVTYLLPWLLTQSKQFPHYQLEDSLLTISSTGSLVPRLTNTWGGSKRRVRLIVAIFLKCWSEIKILITFFDTNKFLVITSG